MRSWDLARAPSLDSYITRCHAAFDRDIQNDKEMNMERSQRLILCLLFLSVSAWAQQTADIVGTVMAENGDTLPGVVVQVESTALQGTRSAVSDSNGSFIVRFLPPGVYTLTATMAGMQTQKQQLVLNVGTMANPKIKMQPESAQEVMVVTAEANPVLDDSQTTSNFKADLVEKLPTNRTITATVSLAPGVSNTGPNGSPSISGAQSFENSYLLNGGMINADNIRGNETELYVEDAIQETTIISGSVSAEYGQFTGGVVNAVTKQGGNEFSGTLRASLTNENWKSKTPLTSSREDKVNDIETLTVGGPIIKDRLWFFFAGYRERDDGENQTSQGVPMDDATAARFGLPGGQTAPPTQSIPANFTEDRYELKLTATLAENHTLVASYLDKDESEENRIQFGVLTPDSVVPSRDLPESLLSLNYRGILSPSFSVEALYTQREMTIQNVSDRSRSFTEGSALEDYNFNGGINYGAHYFGLTPENRDNEYASLKFSYFLSSPSLGTHDIVFGGSDFTDVRKADNEQTPSGWRLFPSATYWDDNGNPVPLFGSFLGDENGDFAFPDLYAGMSYWPILNPSGGSDFNVRSLFINDSWTLNDRMSFNIGARYDANDAYAQDGQKVSDDSKISPRLSASYDLNGDGEHVFNASYGEYVARLSGAADEVSSAGAPALYYWVYWDGPVLTELSDVWSWMVNSYGEDFYLPENARTNADVVREPGISLVLQDGLESPSADESRLGYAKRFGTRGHIKADYIHREYKDFYVGLTNREIGYTPDGTNDLQVLANDDGNYERKYDGVQLQGEWRFKDNIFVGGNYTWSQLIGNIIGETSGSGSVRSTSLTSYPEFSFPNDAPSGYITGDIRHVARAWATYDLNTSFGDFNLSWLQRYSSGQHYSATLVVPTTAAYGFPDGEALGYINPPTSKTYFVYPRGSLKTDDLLRSDLGINYSIRFGKVELFAQFEILNLFDSQKIINPNWVNTTILAQQADGSPATPFNVFTETPVEGVNFRRGDNFGEATDELAYQLPRTFQFDLGFRF